VLKMPQEKSARGVGLSFPAPPGCWCARLICLPACSWEKRHV
jgi:hypothetical protein